jgi:hypothetical protein
MADNEHSLATYVSDMLSLERHVSEPFDSQLRSDAFTKNSDGLEIVTRLSTLSRAHIDSLQTCLDGLGGHAATPMKEAVAGAAGFVASTIDKMRKTELSKALRDDYTALALCCAGYTMLQTTALAMRDSSVAALAQGHLKDYAQAVMDIGEALPMFVVGELSDLGVDVDRTAIEPSKRAASQAWRSAGSSHAAETGSVLTGSSTTAASGGSRN